LQRLTLFSDQAMTIDKYMFRTHIVLVLLSALFISSCRNGKDGEKEELVEADTVKTTVFNIAGELFSVPSPIQTALLIQKSGITYDKNVLSRPNTVNLYSTSFQQAINLGIYGADLGYVSLYNQTQDALGYLAAIKQLSDKLGLTAAFDAATMERIKNNIANKDSMTVLVGLAYRASDSYLKENSRNDVSGLILAGGWIESMHFSILGYNSKKSDQLRYRIAEQKQALNSLVKVVGLNDTEASKKLAARLSELAKVYEGITFKYTFAEPTTDTVRKVTYINSTTEVTVSEEQMKQIGDKIAEIRQELVNHPQS
jgi:hypothetical protein